MRVLVSGATGFVGRHVVANLIDRGHSVTALTRNSAQYCVPLWPAHVRSVTHDLEFGEFNSSLAAHDAIVHLAWPDLHNYKQLRHYETTLPAHYRFLKALVQHGLRQILVAGTCMEYGLRNGCLTESMPPMPANPYATAKDSLRRFLQALQGQHTFTLQWARLFYMYGPGQNPSSLISLVDQAIADGRPSFDMTGGEQLRDYLPVEQAARGLVTLLEHFSADGITNVCSGKPVSVRSLVENRVRQSGANLRLNLYAIRYPEHEPMAFWGDNTRLSALNNSSI